MKNITKIIVSVAISGVLFSCGKDDIEVLNNLDTSWSVDKSITDKDIRTRLGYDPRYNYVLTERTELEFPMLSLGEFSISGENMEEIEVKLLKPLEKDVTVTLQYNAEFFEKVKQKYTGYKLGEETVISIPEKQKTLAKGTTSVKFPITVVNNSSFKESVIIPFSFKADDESVKLLENNDHVLVKIYNKEISYKYPNRIAKNLILGSELSSPYFYIYAEASDVIADDITLSVERGDGKGVANLVPEGVEGKLPDAISLKNEAEALFWVKLEASTLMQGQTYQLPLQIVARIGDKSYVLPNTIMVVINTSLTQDKNAISIPKVSGGYKVKKGEIRASGSLYPYYDSDLANDYYGIYDSAPFGSSSVLQVKFVKEKLINAFEFTFNQQWYKTRLKSVDVYALNSNNEEVYQGTVTIPEKGNGIIGFQSPVVTKGLVFKNFNLEGGTTFGIAEVDVYEE